jgi:hypothetical protein
MTVPAERLWIYISFCVIEEVCNTFPMQMSVTIVSNTQREGHTVFRM